ncbi:MAG: hypothetical protein H6550_09020 [Chitinophagales bacterium]|nr:hypothetical protein [Chitinophagales bacterium]
MMKILIVSVLLVVIFTRIDAQPARMSMDKETGEIDTFMIPWGIYVVTDTVTNNRFILDSSHVLITALSQAGDTLWQTDPWKDHMKGNEFAYYRMDPGERPIIMLMGIAETFLQTQFIPADKSKVPGLHIVFNNSQFGVVFGDSGYYLFLGQD